jgi:hypothetical protein
MTIEDAQAALDAWVVGYNTERPRQSCGGRPPVERFALADRSLVVVDEPPLPAPRVPEVSRPAGVSRWVNQHGRISLAGFDYVVGATFAGEPVELVVTNGLVEILHAGLLVATHAQRFKSDQVDRIVRPRLPVQRRARDATVGLMVTRLADNSGVVSFAGMPYSAGRRWAGSRSRSPASPGRCSCPRRSDPSGAPDPWLAAMVGYTCLSLWLLAQPLTGTTSTTSGRGPPTTRGVQPPAGDAA